MEQAVPEELQPVGRTHVVKVCGRLFPVGGKHAEGREGLKRKQGQKRRKLTIIPCPISPTPLRERVENQE